MILNNLKNSDVYSTKDVSELSDFLDNCILHWLIYCDRHKIKITPDMSKRQCTLYRKLFNYIVSYRISLKCYKKFKSPEDDNNPINIVYKIAGTTFYGFDSNAVKMKKCIDTIKLTDIKPRNYIELRSFGALFNLINFELDQRIANNEDLMFYMNDIYRSIHGSNLINLRGI